MGREIHGHTWVEMHTLAHMGREIHAACWPIMNTRASTHTHTWGGSWGGGLSLKQEGVARILSRFQCSRWGLVGIKKSKRLGFPEHVLGVLALEVHGPCPKGRELGHNGRVSPPTSMRRFGRTSNAKRVATHVQQPFIQQERGGGGGGTNAVSNAKHNHHIKRTKQVNNNSKHVLADQTSRTPTRAQIPLNTSTKTTEHEAYHPAG